MMNRGFEFLSPGRGLPQLKEFLKDNNYYVFSNI